MLSGKQIGSAAIVGWTLLGTASAGQDFVNEEIDKLVAGTAGASHEFGTTVAVDGDTLVVGEFKGGVGSTSMGSAWVFTSEASGWTLQQELDSATNAAGDAFGIGVAVCGDTIAVGAPGDDDLAGDSGAVYVFTRTGTTWTEQAKLKPSGAADGLEMGHSVAIDGDSLIAGAPFAFIQNPSGGAAYVFTRTVTTWSQQARFAKTQSESTDFLGFSVDIEGDTAVAGVPNDIEAGGAAFVYARSGTTWTEQAKLVGTVHATNDLMGQSVSLSGDTVVAGAPFGDLPGIPSAGAAHVFVRSGTVWTEQQRLVSASAVIGDQLGTSVSLEGDKLLAGTPMFGAGVVGRGSAHVFTRGGTVWTERDELTASDAALFDRFGFAVALDGDVAVVGSPLDDHSFDRAGSAYVFELHDAEIVSYCTGKTSSQGCVPFTAVAGAGGPSVSDTNAFNLRGEDHVPGQAGILIYGTSKFQLGYHGGKLCVKNHLRTAAKSAKSVASATCPAGTVGRLRFEFNKVIQQGANPALTVGQRVFGQWIQRDPANTLGGFADNLSDGVRFTILP